MWNISSSVTLEQDNVYIDHLMFYDVSVVSYGTQVFSTIQFISLALLIVSSLFIELQPPNK